MIIVAILNAGRNSFSFFLLLIVCMGYGVVKPSLGRTMVYVRILAITHFVFGVIYSIASLSITPDNAGPLVLLVILPLAGTLTAFYVWTLNSLKMTIKDLVDRKQKIKALMYKKLWWCILGSIVVIFGFFFINSFAFAGRGDADWVPEHWKSRWFILDGWLNIVYFFDISFIAYLWRPTANNRRFAMSDEVRIPTATLFLYAAFSNSIFFLKQIAQDDYGFEINSLANSFDEEDELDMPEDRPHANGARDLASVPPKPIAPAPKLRESLDGETIFAVGEEGDKWSDEDDDSPRNSTDERKKLTTSSSSQIGRASCRERVCLAV